MTLPKQLYVLNAGTDADPFWVARENVTEFEVAAGARIGVYERVDTMELTIKGPGRQLSVEELPDQVSPANPGVKP